MKSLVCLCLCLLAAPLFAQTKYPPTFTDARVEIYRKIDATELKLWIFGESEPGAKKPAVVFFFGGGWNELLHCSRRVQWGERGAAAVGESGGSAE
jgi:acetyl esterase/lipase